MAQPTILLVEDDDAVRLLARRILSRQGYTLLEAGNGFEALKIAERHDGDIDLLLSDVVMPGMSGAELAARLRSQRPALRVLYVSGYLADAPIREGVLTDDDTEYLEKPFTPTTLLERVRAALED